jgi:hypothetical protein
MDRRSWVLMAIDSAGQQGLTPAQLQKVLFLLKQEVPAALEAPDFYEFVPYNYGPFSKLIYHDAEFLAQGGFVNIITALGSSFPIYSITSEGASQSKLLRQVANQQARSYLDLVVNWAKGLSFSQLVTSIYKKYPAYRVNSVFQD